MCKLLRLSLARLATVSLKFAFALLCRGCPASCCRTCKSPDRFAPRAGAHASSSASRTTRFRHARLLLLKLCAWTARTSQKELVPSSRDWVVLSWMNTMQANEKSLPTALQVACSVPEDEPIFQPSPPEIRFQGYAAYNTYEAQLCLRNNDKVCPAHLIYAAAGAAHPCLPSHSKHTPFHNVMGSFCPAITWRL